MSNPSTYKLKNPPRDRPLTSSIGFVTYKFSKWLVIVLSPFVGTVSDSFLKDREDLISKV